jgi:hypothetical protein
MGEMKPTPGPWTANYCKDGCYFKGKNRDGWTIDGPDMVPDYENPMFNEADARLIAEAGTVFHNTGLSPVQLVEQRDDLLAACKKLVEWDEREKDHAISFMQRISLCDEAFSMMRAALAKCEGVK